MYGVNWDKFNNSWRATIIVNRYRYDLGRHKDINDAIKIRKDAEHARDNGCLNKWLKGRGIPFVYIKSPRGVGSTVEGKPYNMLNKVFGTWRVKEKINNISPGDRNLRFDCECIICGRKRVLWGAKLRSGNYTNCKHRTPRTCYSACVSYVKTTNRWLVSKIHNGKTYYIGSSKDEKTAHALKEEVNNQADFMEWYSKKKGADKDAR
jgi:hypothetical protein